MVDAIFGSLLLLYFLNIVAINEYHLNVSVRFYCSRLTLVKHFLIYDRSLFAAILRGFIQCSGLPQLRLSLSQLCPWVQFPRKPSRSSISEAKMVCIRNFCKNAKLDIPSSTRLGRVHRKRTGPPTNPARSIPLSAAALCNTTGPKCTLILPRNLTKYSSVLRRRPKAPSLCPSMPSFGIDGRLRLSTKS